MYVCFLRQDESSVKETAPPLPPRPHVHSFCKTLSATDTSIHGGFSVLRHHADECLLTSLDTTRQPPMPELAAKDLHGIKWRFKHIFLEKCGEDVTSWKTKKEPSSPGNGVWKVILKLIPMVERHTTFKSRTRGNWKIKLRSRRLNALQRSKLETLQAMLPAQVTETDQDDRSWGGSETRFSPKEARQLMKRSRMEMGWETSSFPRKQSGAM